MTSKLWMSDHGEERARAAIESSLEELGTDYIDLYLMHGPGNMYGGQAARHRRIQLRATAHRLQGFSYCDKTDTSPTRAITYGVHTGYIL